LAANAEAHSASMTTCRASTRLIQIIDAITVTTVTSVAAGRMRRARRAQKPPTEIVPVSSTSR
jgi:hypothetical protein